MFPENVILVVGSESDESESVAQMLAGGYRVIGAETPDDALSYAGDGVNLVISQLDSPDFSGLQFLKTWNSRGKRIPFIFITEGTDVTSVVDAMKLGAVDCLVKPVNAAHLRAAVSNALSQKPDADDKGDPGRKFEIPPGTSLEQLERLAVEQALAEHQGNRTHAAKTLGISVRTLQRKLKAWGLPVLGALQSPPQQSNGGFFYSNQPASPPSYSAHAT